MLDYYIHDIYKEYLNRKNENDVVGIRDNKYFTKNFKKAAALYFRDCKMLVEKIINKEFRRRHIEDIVNFYNSKCHKPNQ